MQQEAKVITCGGCGASLNVEINRPFIFCQYCGCKNIIEQEQMKATINLGRTNVSASTDMESLLNTVDYLISSGKYKEADEYLTALFVSGGSNDCRVYLYRAMLDLHLNGNENGFQSWDHVIKVFSQNSRAVFDDLNRLRALEPTQQDREVTDAICRLIQYQGSSFPTILHLAAFYEMYDMVVYCVEHGADVNAHFHALASFSSSNTPINLLAVGWNEASYKATMPNGTLFIRNKAVYKQILQYLKSHGGREAKYSIFSELWNADKH